MSNTLREWLPILNITEDDIGKRICDAAGGEMVGGSFHFGSEFVAGRHTMPKRMEAALSFGTLTVLTEEIVTDENGYEGWVTENGRWLAVSDCDFHPCPEEPLLLALRVWGCDE